jgi:hypothetical protein
MRCFASSFDIFESFGRNIDTVIMFMFVSYFDNFYAKSPNVSPVIFSIYVFN